MSRRAAPRDGTASGSQVPGKAGPEFVGPEFLVIGAMKAGTTALYHMLSQHPRIGMSRMKETDFFIAEKNLSLGLRWYLAQFPAAPCRGEVSPNYAKDDIFPGTAARASAALPRARILFLARDPVARFAAHYRHAWATGNMQVPPDALLSSPEGQHMLETSRYWARLAPWRAAYPAEALLTVGFEALIADPQAQMQRIFAHLGLDPVPVALPATRNEAASVARVPASVQRLWRSRSARRLDALVGRQMRNAARRLLARGPVRPVPALPEAVLAQAAEALAEDAARFRAETGLSLPGWAV